jgi:hypothetical protein
MGPIAWNACQIWDVASSPSGISVSAIGSSTQENSCLNEAGALGFVVGLDHSSTLFIRYGRCIGIISVQIDHLVAGIALYI